MQIGNLKFGIWYLVLAFALLGWVYSVVTPIMEAPDEVWHFAYARYVAEGNGLPPLHSDDAPSRDSGAYQEVGQPPLYYLVAGLVIASVREYDLKGIGLSNPGFGYQAPGTVNDNKNLRVHTTQEAFPWHGAVLAVHLARFVALAFGALAVLATFALAHEAFPASRSIPLAAAALMAFTPQFLFISGIASNDSSAVALSTGALWASARTLRHGVTLRRAALTGLLVGLACLTKTSTILLGLFAVAAIVLVNLATVSSSARTAGSRHTAAWREALAALALLIVVALVVGGWWYTRNALLYRDPLGLSVHVNTPWGRPEPVSLAEVWRTMPLVYRSFWGAFGWGNVEMSPAIYMLLGLVLVIAAVGWLYGFRIADCGLRSSRLKSEIHNPQSTILLMCGLWCAAIFVSFLGWNQQVAAPHGRLLFPALGAFTLLLAAGLARLPRPRLVLGAVLGFLLLLSLAVPFVYIQPAYATPALFPADQVVIRHPSFVIRRMNYGIEAQLIAFGLDRPSAAPGEWVNVELCWTALRPMTKNYSVFVHLLGRDNLVVGARSTWPGLGRFPTSLWPVGQAFCDTIPVRVEAWTPVPGMYAVEVVLHDTATDDRLEAAETDSGMPVVPPIVGTIRIAPTQPLRVSPQYTAQADFGSAVLLGYDAPLTAHPGENVPLTLYWRAVNTLDQNYTVFVHLVAQSGQLAAQADAQPRSGAYPASAWVPGDVIPDEHTLALPTSLPPGEYALRAGLYVAPDGPRLALKPSGDTLTLGTLQVR